MEFDQVDGEEEGQFHQQENNDLMTNGTPDINMEADDDLLGDLHVGDNLLADMNDSEYNAHGI